MREEIFSRSHGGHGGEEINMKTKDVDVVLNKNGQFSLICFIGVLIVQPITLLLAQLGVSPLTNVFVAYIITLPLFGISVILGIKQLRQSKFPLLWIIPAFVYSLIVIFGLFFILPYDRGKLIRTPKRKIGVLLNKTENGEMQINAVMYHSPADKAGIKGGDIITKINNEVIDNEDYRDVSNLIGSTKNNPLTIEIEREGEKKIFNINNFLHEVKKKVKYEK